MIEKLVVANCDWISVIGLRAEWLYDQIDVASVRMGKQGKVGDGSPITAWDVEMLTYALAAEHCTEHLYGGNDFLLIVIVGDIEQYNEFVKELRKRVWDN